MVLATSRLGGEKEVIMSKTGSDCDDRVRSRGQQQQQHEQTGEVGNDSINMMGESMVSLDAHFLMDKEAPPPETTRPDVPSAWAVGSNGRQSSRRNLNIIMNEQRAQQMVMEDDNNYYPPQQPTYQQQEDHQNDMQGKSEEEMLRIAMDRSMSEMNIMSNNSDRPSPQQRQQQQQQQRPNMSSFRQVSQRSFTSISSHDSDLAQRIQEEADRTETALVDSPHTNESGGSSRRSVRRLHSWEEEEGRFPDRRAGMSRRVTSSREIRVPLRRQPTGDSSTRGGSYSPGPPRRTFRRAASNPAIMAGGSYNNTPVSRTRSSRTISSSSPRQSPSSANSSAIRIGPLPKEMLRSSRTTSQGRNGGKLLTEGAEAVLEVARQNLPPEEVALIEQALRVGSGGRSNISASSDVCRGVSPAASCGSMDLSRALSDDPVYRSPRRGSRRYGQLHGENSRHSVTSVSTSESYSSGGGSHSSSGPHYHRQGVGAAAAAAAAPQEIPAYNPDAAPVDTASYNYNDVLLSEGNLSNLSAKELQEIEKALEKADQEAELRSLQMAHQIQAKEERRRQQLTSPRRQQGNVRTMNRAELEAERNVGAFSVTGPPNVCHPMDDDGDVPPAAGYRMNPSSQQEWVRRDQNSVIGPNNEVRTKHDIELDGVSNAHRLGLEEDDDGRYANVGHKAYNSFMQSVRSKNKKGVAAHGTGRAGSEADGTTSGGLDHNVRLQIGKAINSGLIEKCNGVVKEGKEAVVFHADKGPDSGGFDVAVKVFKRIQEFKGRGSYVDGDPRYARDNFRKASNREQLNLWTEKEFRNLMRANNAGVLVPMPLLCKENVLFMRFLGANGWPSPQLRDLTYRRGSSKWESLYDHVMDSVRKLYKKGRLVHGDLSEYNILVVPSSLIENSPDGNPEGAEGAEVAVPVLIDFGQAVDLRHPDAVILLQRDLERVSSFFSKRGIKPMEVSDALSFVVGDDEESSLGQSEMIS